MQLLKPVTGDMHIIRFAPLLTVCPMLHPVLPLFLSAQVVVVLGTCIYLYLHASPARSYYAKNPAPSPSAPQVVLDPRMREALLRGPLVSFETVVPEQRAAALLNDFAEEGACVSLSRLRSLTAFRSG